MIVDGFIRIFNDIKLRPFLKKFSKKIFAEFILAKRVQCTIDPEEALWNVFFTFRDFLDQDLVVPPSLVPFRTKRRQYK